MLLGLDPTRENTFIQNNAIRNFIYLSQDNINNINFTNY